MKCGVILDEFWSQLCAGGNLLYNNVEDSSNGSSEWNNIDVLDLINI